MTDRFDVVVIGGGNAGFSAAHAAREAGARVLVLEKAPRSHAGGNSYFTAGAFRVPHDGAAHLAQLLADPDSAAPRRVEIPPYPTSAFEADLDRLTRGRSQPDLSNLLVGQAWDAVSWLVKLGFEFDLLTERQSYEIDGRRRFWGGLTVGVRGQGPALVERHLEIAEREEVEVRFEAAVREITVDDHGAVTGASYVGPDGPGAVRASSVIIAAGGFEADARRRAQYLGPGWDLAKVRGAATNTGEILHLALDLGAAAAGHWSGCHSVAWEASAGDQGDRELTNLLTKQSYPLGIVVNADGHRFVDEGADFRNYTYAKYGAEILRQPHALAFQIFDAKTVPSLQRGEYDHPGVNRHSAASLEALAEQVAINPSQLTATINDYNAAVAEDVAFDPTVLDGRSAMACEPPKSNWAQRIDEPPFVAFPATTGITFTFGGVRVDSLARVLNSAGQPIRGLFAAGELVGGLFYSNYPGGSGLTAGTVFGRQAGIAAAEPGG